MENRVEAAVTRAAAKRRRRNSHVDDRTAACGQLAPPCVVALYCGIAGCAQVQWRAGIWIVSYSP